MCLLQGLSPLAEQRDELASERSPTYRTLFGAPLFPLPLPILPSSASASSALLLLSCLNLRRSQPRHQSATSESSTTSGFVIYLAKCQGYTRTYRSHPRPSYGNRARSAYSVLIFAYHALLCCPVPELSLHFRTLHWQHPACPPSHPLQRGALTSCCTATPLQQTGTAFLTLGLGVDTKHAQ